MSELKVHFSNFLSKKGEDLTKRNDHALLEFCSQSHISQALETIIKLEEEIMSNWKVRTRILDFNNLTISIPNGTEGIKYSHKVNSERLFQSELTSFKFEGLEDLGLTYNQETSTIEGMPCVNGAFKLSLLFKVEGELDHEPFNRKEINFVLNPDPKSLWKNIPSNPEAIYWKPDTRSNCEGLGTKNIVVSSKRGRSHQNVGSFRDDDYGYKYFEKTDWSVVAVADGAGSASFSRKGSLLACEEVIRYFTEIMPLRDFISFETKINAYAASNDPAMLEAATIEAKKGLYKATLHVHKKIHEVAEATAIAHPELFTNSKAKNNAEYFHSTLIFTAFKKFDMGYVILTFGVGDCPIGIVNANRTEAKLLNWLDVGEFGGGTRFITQADIFHSNERPMASRFNLHIHPDFSYLFLMTDGIYDPKFEVEANLEKNEKWLDFIADIKGVNDDNVGVDFKSPENEIQAQLDTWMDFWSKGNHDDRTLAIIY